METLGICHDLGSIKQGYMLLLKKCYHRANTDTSESNYAWHGLYCPPQILPGLERYNNIVKVQLEMESVLQCGQANTGNRNKIVGGVETKENEYPWQVSILYVQEVVTLQKKNSNIFATENQVYTIF